MAFKKSDRVEITVKGEVLAGSVQSARAGKTVVALDDGRTTKPLPEAHFRASTKPLPAGVQPTKSWAKGDRIEFESKGVMVHATVRSAGAMLRVVADGGEVEFSVPLGLAKPSTKALPQEPPGPMDRWMLKNYRKIERMSRETPAFTADIARDGKVVLHVSNDGNGGSNRYEPDANASYAVIKEFDTDVAAWWESVGGKSKFEVETYWIDWNVENRPYAVTARQYAEKIETMSPQDEPPAP